MEYRTKKNEHFKFHCHYRQTILENLKRGSASKKDHSKLLYESINIFKMWFTTTKVLNQMYKGIKKVFKNTIKCTIALER